MRRYIAGGLILFALCLGRPYDPTDYGLELYRLIRGTEQQKKTAMTALRKYCKRYGVKEKKMYNVIKLESQGKIKAFCRRTEARGLCQLREIALKSLPFADRYYLYYRDENGRLKRTLNKKRVYDIDWNIRAGCSFMSVCQDMAPNIRRRFPFWMRLFISEEKVSVFMYNWGYGNVSNMLGAMKYAEGF